MSIDDSLSLILPLGKTAGKAMASAAELSQLVSRLEAVTLKLESTVAVTAQTINQPGEIQYVMNS